MADPCPRPLGIYLRRCGARHDHINIRHIRIPAQPVLFPLPPAVLFASITFARHFCLATMISNENTQIFLETIDTMLKYRTMLPNLIDAIYEAPMRQARLTGSDPDIPEGEIEVLYEAID